MTRGSQLAEVIDRLEKFYGKPKTPKSILRSLTGRTDPYEMIVYTTCGYPASDAACAKGFAALKKEVGIRPADILGAPEKKLVEILRLGGIVPELRAQRLREIAARVKHEFGGNLSEVLERPLPEVRKALKSFPTIGDSGVDKILLFTRTAPIAAVPSNCPEVTVRLMHGQPYKNYGVNYREAQGAVRAGVPADCTALLRAYLLLKHHGQEICKRTRPLCDQCPVARGCAYFRSRRHAGGREDARNE